MRILIIGAGGLLGNALLQQWPHDEIFTPASRDCDVRNRGHLERTFAHVRPEWILLAAAFTDVDGCEKDPDRAYEVNCRGAARVAELARANGSRLLFLSTDYVFDGSKGKPYEIHDPVCPVNVYGRSKAEAEREISRILPTSCIVRTSWLFGVHGKCFPNTILKLAGNRSRIPVVDDQVGSPTFNRDLARSIKLMVEKEVHGIVHATNADSCSWYDFAVAIIQANGTERVCVDPVSSREFPRLARRPAYSVLSGATLADWGIRMRPWRETVNDYFAERKGNTLQ